MAASILGKRRRSEAKPNQLRNETAFQVLEDCTDSLVACKKARHNVHAHNSTVAEHEESTLLPGTTFEDENQTSLPSTPHNSRQRDALATGVFATPKRYATLRTPNSSRNIRTPTTEANSHRSFYREARKAFTRGCGSERLVGRDTERGELQSFLADSMSPSAEGALYVSGPPGTGKSALVQEVSQDLSKNSTSMKRIYMNCVLFNDALELFTFMAGQVGLETRERTELDLKRSLQALFFDQKPKQTRYVLILDEIDAILNLEHSVIHTIFDWCFDKTSNLILIGIANAIDLTDRLLPRLKALNLRPRLLPFSPYGSKEIADVITAKLRALLPPGSTALPSFTPLLQTTAIQLISKKIAAQSGDLRKAFDLVLRTIDVLESETRQLASLDHLQEKGQTSPRSPLSENKNYSSPPLTPRNSPAKVKGMVVDRLATIVDAESAPRATVTHIVRIISTTLGNSSSQRLKCLNLHQKLALCSLVALEHQRMADPTDVTQTLIQDGRTPIKGSAFAVAPSARSTRTVAPSFQELYENYHRQCSTNEGISVLSQTEFKDVVTSLETTSLVSVLDRKSGKTRSSPSAIRKGKKALSHVQLTTFEKFISANIGREELEAAVVEMGGPLAGMLSSIMSRTKDG